MPAAAAVSAAKWQVKLVQYALAKQANPVKVWNGTEKTIYGESKVRQRTQNWREQLLMLPSSLGPE